jgi:hypothetical protein
MWSITRVNIGDDSVGAVRDDGYCVIAIIGDENFTLGRVVSDADRFGLACQRYGGDDAVTAVGDY